MTDADFIRLAARLARRGRGSTSPNPMVGALLVRNQRIIGRGWHRRAGRPHAEIEAFRDAQRHARSPKGATLYVTLEPCCTHGRTPPCTEAIVAAGIRRVVAGATDPNPKHAGKGFRILKRAGLRVTHGVNAAECERLNETYNHWIVRQTPFVTVKAAMTLDGKIATAGGQSKWITSEKARAHAMNLRQSADAILVGINTVLADDPSLTVRRRKAEGGSRKSEGGSRKLRRIILDAMARTPLTAKVVCDGDADLTTIVVSKHAPKSRIAALARTVRVLVAPTTTSKGRNSKPETQPLKRLDLRWVLRKLGAEQVTHLLVEGGGEVNASFLLEGLAQRVAFFYAPKILGGRDSKSAVAGAGASNWNEILDLKEARWQRLGPDLLLTALVSKAIPRLKT
jgi:diaminohydroxyphosphoribosylaminopyrimidine deaminase / 5-amino-6-(5-phosphoribosylamino)uracil reductase